jgi:hypothetical protein
MPKVHSLLPILSEDGRALSKLGEGMKGYNSYTKPLFIDLHGEESCVPVLCITPLSALSIYPMSFR